MSQAQDFVTAFMNQLAGSGVTLNETLQGVFAKILANQVVVTDGVVNPKPAFASLSKVFTYVATPATNKPTGGINYADDVFEAAKDDAATDNGLTLGGEAPVDPTEPGVEGETFSLTTGADVIVGTENDDVINGLAGSYATSTLNKDDQIDGGAGNDTLNVELTSKFGGFTGDGFLKNVETVNLANDGTSTRLFDAANVEGVETYNLDGMVDLNTLNSADIAVNVANRDSGTVKIQYADKVTEGTEDVLNLGITNLGSAATKEGTKDIAEQKVTVAAAGIENLNLNATGANFVTLNTAAVKAINVTGEGSLKLNGLAADVKDIDIDASALAGNLDLELGNAADVNSVKGGAGDDVITATAKNLKVNSKIDGGAGQDTLVLNKNTTATLQLDMVGVETIKLDANSGGLTYSATKTAGLENLIVTGDTSGGATFASMEGDLNVTLDDAVSGSVSSDHDGATTLNITGKGTKDVDAIANTTGLSFSKTANLDVTVAAFNKYTGEISAAAAEAANLTLNGTVEASGSLSLDAAESLVINDNNKAADTLTLKADKLQDLTLNVNGAAESGDFTLASGSSVKGLKALNINTDGAVDTSSGDMTNIADITLNGMGAVKLGKLGDANAEDSITITAVGLAGTATVKGLETGTINTGAGNSVDIDVSEVLGEVKLGAITVADSAAPAVQTGSITITAEGTAGAIELGTLSAKTVTIDAGDALGTIGASAAPAVIVADEVSFTGSSIAANSVDVTAAKATIVGSLVADEIEVTGAKNAAETVVELTGGLGADKFTIAAAGSISSGDVVNGVTISAGDVSAANKAQQMVVTITDFKADEDKLLGATGFNDGINSLAKYLTTASGSATATSFGVDSSGVIAVINSTGKHNEGKAELINGTDANKFFDAFNAFEGVSGLSKDNTKLATVDLNGSPAHTAGNIALGLLDTQGNFYTINNLLGSDNTAGNAMLVKLVGVETLETYDFAVSATV